MLLLISVSIIYLTIEIGLFVSILLIPVIVKMNTYKWYQLNIELKEGTFFKKVFYKNKQQEYLNLVSLNKQQLFYSQIKANVQIKKNPESTATVENFSIQTFNIVK